jgi:hypothetical protein
MTATNHAASRNRKLPVVADVTFVVGWAMSVLIGFAHECGRRDHAGIAGVARVLIVDIERIVVADRESEVTNRREPKFPGVV